MSGRGAGSLREGALWGAAAASVLALHAAGLWWLNNRAEASALPGIPEAVFVDLAPIPEAAAPLAEEESQELSGAVEPEPEPEPEQEPEPEPEPEVALDPLPELEELPDMATLLPPPTDAVVLQSSARPRARPERPEPEPEPEVAERREERRREEPRRERAPQQQATQRATQVQGQQSNRTAAQSGGANASPAAKASWAQQIQGRVTRHMMRTRHGAKRGVVSGALTLSISPTGQVTSVRLTQSSGDANVDAALSRQAGRMPRLVPPPSGRTESLTIPFRVEVR